jgi:hypothetical protein
MIITIAFRGETRMNSGKVVPEESKEGIIELLPSSSASRSGKI